MADSGVPPSATTITTLHADPATKLCVTSPQFDKTRAGGLGLLLHIVPVLLVLLVLRGVALPPAPVVPSLQLVLDKSPYVGSGPNVVTPVPAPKPQPAVPSLTSLPPLLAPPAPTPPAPMRQPLTTLPPSKPSPAQPPLSKPPLSKPPPRPAITAHAPAYTPAPAAAATAHRGDNQPVGYGQAFGRMIVATTDATLNRKPPYPEAARAHGEQGRVLLSIHVAANGRVVQVDVTASSGFAILDQAAQSTALKWLFNPAMLNGKPVASVVVFPILFQLDAP